MFMMLPDSELSKEKERLRKSGIPKEYQDKIQQFLNDERVNGLPNENLYFYAIRLRQIASLMPEYLLSPSVNDAKSLLSKLMEGKICKRIKGGNSSDTYSDFGFEYFKNTMKEFYSWPYRLEKPECVAWPNSKSHPSKNVKSDNIITEEVQNLVGVVLAMRRR